MANVTYGGPQLEEADDDEEYLDCCIEDGNTHTHMLPFSTV